MRPLLQEAQFACFEDEEGVTSSDVSALPSFVVSSPAVRSQPPKSFARVRALECSGSGSFYFQNESLRDRFVCWRVLKNVVVLREWSLNTTLRQNGIRLEFPAPVVNTGVFAVESWEDDAVTINVVSHAGTIHRFTYAVPSDKSLSIFSQSDTKAFPEPRPATRTRCDVLQVLNSDEILSVALWVNEYNLVLGTDSGRVLGVNFGLPSDAKKMQEFAFSDESVVSWLWNGLIKTTAAKFKGGAEEGERRDVGAAIVAMTCFQIDAEDEESESENGEKDVCVITVSADCVLRAWSFGAQSCLGRQQLRSLVTPQPKEEEGDNDEAKWENEDLDGDDGVNTLGVYATHAKVVALSPTESDNCRLLVHLDTTAAHSTEIFLLRGDVQPVSASSAGTGGEELALDTARVFTVQNNNQKSKRGLKMVDFAVDKHFLFSSWRSLDGDEVYIHPNPMALTGPKRIQGQLVSSLDVQMQKYEAEDSEWLFDLKEEGVMTMIDDFFAERILLPGRFSRQNLSNVIVEAQNGSLSGFSSRSPFTHRLPKYKDVLVRLVSSRCVDAAGAAAVRTGTAPSVLRIQIWKELIALCTKHWRCENVPIGFATTTNALLPGAPVMLRRNRVSLLFPSAPSITAAFIPQAEQGSSTAECIADLVSEVLPVFDAFPSQSFQSFIHREVADVASDWKVESFVALARHCVRLGLNPDFVANAPVTGQTISAELMLTRSILRLSKLLGGDAGFQDQVFRDLVEHLFPFELSRGSGAYKSSSPSSDEDEEMTNTTEDFTMADAAAPTDYYSTTRRTFFAGHEMCFAFDQVASRTIDEMCNQSLRAVLFLAYLVDTRPAFLSSATLSKIVQVYLPKSITVYQRWRLSRWVASQGITQPLADIDPAITSSATLMPPLLQMFLLDVNRKLNRSGNFKRALSLLQLASASNNVRSEEAHGVLATFTREILQFVSQPNDSLVRFLQKRQQFRLLRAMFCCNLSDISLHGSRKGEAASSQHSEQVHQYVRSIGECLACEGQEAAARAHDEDDARDRARWCFQQAIRCFSICLSNFFAERKPRSSRSEKALEQFIYDVVGLLKETVPRGFYDQLLSFLWTVVTQALSHLAHHDGGEQSFALQSFIWVNVFKYSVEERLFRDAHLALMHTADLSAALSGSETAADAEGTASECVNYLVKELYRYGHLDLICELQWGSLESHVEKYILWQAANATVVHGEGLDAGAIRYYNLLFTFYMRKQQPANAASSLYALALRLRLAVSTSKAALEAQRNALNAACNALRALPVENRWVVRKLHTEELKRPTLDPPEGSKLAPSLSVVTLEDMRRELSVLDGKLRLLALGHSESVLLSTMDSDEVVALLVDAVHSSCNNPGNTTLSERRRAGLLSIETAADIAGRSSGASLINLTKSLARYCVASEHPAASSSISRSDSDLLWDLLEDLLKDAAKLEQYEVAAETVLDFWQQQGRKLTLPAWLYKRLASPTSGSPAKLLTLYLKHGLLLEALQLVGDLLPDVNAMRGGNAKSAFSFQSQMEPSAGPPELPWIPYNLIDALLDSTSAVLNQGAGGDVSSGAITRLRTQDHSIREQLTRYFRSANALQQAQEAANLARSSIDLDL
ncbi:hypothetical protein PR003_g2178 [Phytophthora rubi]|uniref:Nucleoporin n=1 Tax=Phytophthora rubi TaxID=129364 RepID=A0A6A3NDW4_9STRA|nr:hypothetical protein PR002_g5485 [Phytophthora rubi]KAE9045101.1 hypothetical protein PR001_g5098 [Phytophthora rubi]KAE9356754.1 hypothetical protein PR003_g2178 [Phytophthora rubi]